MKDTNIFETPLFPREDRNFETRITFIHDIFSSKHTAAEIMAHSIKYKLGISYDNYIRDLSQNTWQLYGENPMAVLKRIDK